MITEAACLVASIMTSVDGLGFASFQFGSSEAAGILHRFRVTLEGQQGYFFSQL